MSNFDKNYRTFTVFNINLSIFFISILYVNNNSGLEIFKIISKFFVRKLKKMSFTSSILFKVGCAGMISVLGLGARYGHAGQLS